MLNLLPAAMYLIPIAKSLKIRNKEITFHSIDYYIASFFSFAFDAKETKDQGKKNAPPFFRAYAQRLRLFEMSLLVLQ